MTADQARAIEELTRACHSTLGGPDWQAPFLAHGIDPDAALAWTMGWVDLAADDPVVGEGSGRAFGYRVALAMLAVGVDYGRSRPSERQC